MPWVPLAACERACCMCRGCFFMLRQKTLPRGKGFDVHPRSRESAAGDAGRGSLVGLRGARCGRGRCWEDVAPRCPDVSRRCPDVSPHRPARWPSRSFRNLRACGSVAPHLGAGVGAAGSASEAALALGRRLGRDRSLATKCLRVFFFIIILFYFSPLSIIPALPPPTAVRLCRKFPVPGSEQ